VSTRANRGAERSARSAGEPESRAEAQKIARLLGLRDAAALSYLCAVPAEELVAYREELIEALYDEGRDQLALAADASRLMPARLLAKIGESALGPLTCARLTGLIDPARAAEISEHFSAGFLAQLAAELDPRRAVDVVTQLDGERVVEIAVEMAARGEQVAMGRFVAHLAAPTLSQCIVALSDEDVVRVAFVAEGEKPQERIFKAAGVARIRGALEQAERAGLTQEAQAFRSGLSASARKRLDAAAAS
jgi:hypothetical protein